MEQEEEGTKKKAFGQNQKALGVEEEEEVLQRVET